MAIPEGEEKRFLKYPYIYILIRFKRTLKDFMCRKYIN